MSDPFEDPVTATPLPYSELQGSLLLFRVLSYEEHIPNVFTVAGEKSPAVSANVSVLDGPKRGTEFTNVLVFPKKLQAQLRPRVGKMVLGRLGQGDAKPGQNAPWELIAATAQEKQMAMAAATAEPASGAGPGPASAPGSSASGEPPF